MSDKPSDNWGEVARRTPTRAGFWTTYRVLWVIFLTLGMVGLLLALSEWNHRRFQLVCGKSAVTAERGRYWPVGSAPLEGKAYDALPIHLAPACESKTFSDQSKLDEAYLALLFASVSRELVPGPPANATATVTRLKQAELLCKGKNLAGCEDGKRFQADLDYFQSLDEIKTLKASLDQTRARLAAGSLRQSHHQKDMKLWADHLQRVMQQLDRPGAAGAIVIPIPVPMRVTLPALTPEAPEPAPAPAPAAPAPAPAATPTPPPTTAPAPVPENAEPSEIPKGGVLM